MITIYIAALFLCSFLSPFHITAQFFCIAFTITALNLSFWITIYIAAQILSFFIAIYYYCAKSLFFDHHLYCCDNSLFFIAFTKTPLILCFLSPFILLSQLSVCLLCSSWSTSHCGRGSSQRERWVPTY